MRCIVKSILLILIIILVIFLILVYIVLKFNKDDDIFNTTWDFRGEIIHNIPNSNSHIIIKEYSYLHSVSHSVYYVDSSGEKNKLGSVIGEKLNFTIGDYQIKFSEDGVSVLYYLYGADENFTEDYYNYPINIE